MEWKNIWKQEPPRNEDIFFMTGDGDIHLGLIFSEEKLRKCKFYSFYKKYDYECDLQTPYDKRVIYWFPIPKQPERSNPEGQQYGNSEQLACDDPNSGNK